MTSLEILYSHVSFILRSEKMQSSIMSTRNKLIYTIAVDKHFIEFVWLKSANGHIYLLASQKVQGALISKKA